VVLASLDRYCVTTKSSIEIANATAALATIAGASSGSMTRRNWSRRGAPKVGRGLLELGADRDRAGPARSRRHTKA
jgi:hypothetical protein